MSQGKQNSQCNNSNSKNSQQSQKSRRNSTELSKILLENERTNEEIKLERLRNKAKLEIGEVEELIPEKIQEMKDIISAGDQKYHMHPEKYDDFFLKCLRAKKYETDRAAKLYKKYCSLRAKNNDWVCSMIPSHFSTQFNEKLASVLRTRDNRGRHVLIVRVEKWDPKVTGFDQLLSTLMLICDEIVNTVDTQLHGIVVIGDLRGLSLSHARLIRPAQMSVLASVLQDAYPARFKEVHAFNNPYIFNMIWSILKPLVKEKMRKRIYFHGSDVGSLHRGLSIDSKLLPEFLGGQVPEEEYADMGMIQNLVKRDDYYKDFTKYGSPAKSDESEDEY